MDSLLQAEAEAEAVDKMRPVLAAAEIGDAAALAAALDQAGLAVDTPGEDNDTALHMGCLYGHTAVVQECLRRGAAVNARDEDNSTPLHDASAGGHYDIIKLLLAAGADVAAVDDDGDTPLHLASNGGHAHVAAFLLGQIGSDEQRAVALSQKNALDMRPCDLADDPTLVAQLTISSDADEGAAYKKKRG